MKILVFLFSLLVLAACTRSEPPRKGAPQVAEVKTISFLDLDSQKIVFHVIGERSYQHGDEIHVTGSPDFYVVVSQLESLTPNKDGTLALSSDVVYKVRKQVPVVGTPELKRQ